MTFTCSCVSTAWEMKNAKNAETSISTNVTEAEHQQLGPEHRQPLRHRHEARADHAGRVLAGDDQYAEHADRQLSEVVAGETRVDRAESRLVVRLIVDQRDISIAAITIPKTIEITATSSVHRVERSDHSLIHSELITRACVTLPRRRGCVVDGLGVRECRAHAAALSGSSKASVRYSTASRVIRMNASSSDTCCGTSS